MAWIKSHQGLKRHPKLHDLATMLGVSRVTAIGHLHALWYDVLEYAPDGDLSRFRHPVIAGFAEWEGDPDLFVNSLVESGWLDRADDQITIHDWEDYTGGLMRVRERTRQRVQKHRARALRKDEPDPGNAPVTRYTGVRPPDVTRNTSVTPSDVTEPEERRGEEKREEKDTQRAHAREDGADAPVCVLTQEGRRLHEAYPEARRSTENATMVAIRKHIKPPGHTVDFAIERIEVWKRSDQWQRGIIPRLSKFFAEGTWLAEPIQARASPSRPRTPLEDSLDFASFEGLKNHG